MSVYAGDEDVEIGSQRVFPAHGVFPTAGMKEVSLTWGREEDCCNTPGAELRENNLGRISFMLRQDTPA